MKINQLSREKINHSLYFILSSLLIILPAIWNRFPLVFFDSGTYINSCFTLEAPIDRPVGYGLFMRIVSWKSSLWLVLVSQAMIMNYLIIKSLKLFTDPKKLRYYHLPLIITLSIFTGLGWASSQIMPDFFTAVLGLSAILLFFDKQIRLFDLILLCAFIFFSLISHYSHLVIGILFMVFSLLFFFKYLRKNIDSFLLKLGLYSTLIILSFLFIAFYNYKSNMGFKISHSSQIFLNARLYGSGVLKKYLDENCESHPCFLCKYKNELPDAQYKMLWGDESPFRKEGLSWTEANQQLKEVNIQILSKPKYFLLFTFESLKSSLVQLTQVNVGSGIFPYIEGSSPHFNMKKFREPEFIPYANSRQNWDQLDFKTINNINYFLHLLAFLVIFLAFSKHIPNKELRMIIWLIILFVISNAVVTASLSNIYDRTQSRVSWLIILAAALMLPQILQQIKQKRL